MSSKKQGWLRTSNLIIGLLGLLIAIASFSTDWFRNWTPELFRQTRFSCTLQLDTQKGGEVWTVMYRNDKEVKPWLRMVNSFGDGWDTRTRCDEITKRLEGFRQDGLLRFSYRTDPKTPKQDVICVHTKLDPQNCNLLVTLKPGADGYDSLRRMTMAIQNGTTVDQGSGTSQTPNSSFVSVEGLLASDDLQAGASVGK
ncbi:COP23 domain-containing protein [Aetokthonos hydrillicola Thurmond2011]|jgi:hypothetical protein|uniref:COP23 domain-containing protein n=1 Tax=Aetokthonos hydrillicola Thurmond2011 TaxID=2712845 RepID=A0AAP5MDN8_9CYAN|nr:COP23 domain-containing protein [Aetokthonos hydrillicola]MBO3462071.1 hypothetical protein [Aetokthonos hydrillicola CCALA 1050]MBW4585583.1 COP23 domain-containing protein [Aetokthonos hydrillicola CCALA 1050]MDR9900827.1 COP23 domain-containing protein [Aetokthonos hydrillicola Thurmond2011]